MASASCGSARMSRIWDSLAWRKLGQLFHQEYLDIYSDFESGLHTLDFNSEEILEIIRILDQLVSDESSSALSEKA